jgi:NitT/TauT family transport system substrate-binding protein
MHTTVLRATRALTLALTAAVIGISVTPTSVRAADPIVINVGALPVDTSAVVFYAQDQGFFKAAGLDVHIQTMASGPVIAQAVAASAIDIGVANVATVASARLRGVLLKFIAPAAIASDQTRTDLIMVSKDSPVQKASDLNGKTIGLNGLKDLQQICAMAWVDKHGGDSKTLKFIEVPFPTMGGALEQKRVDAALPVEPFVSADRATARSLGSVLDGVGSRYMIVGWLASDAWLATHADAASRFASAIAKAAVWANDHEKESAAILVKNSKLDPATADTMARAIYGTKLEPALLQPVIDAAVKYGVIDKPVPTSDLIWNAPK